MTTAVQGWMLQIIYKHPDQMPVWLPIMETNSLTVSYHNTLWPTRQVPFGDISATMILPDNLMIEWADYTVAATTLSGWNEIDICVSINGNSVMYNNCILTNATWFPNENDEIEISASWKFSSRGDTNVSPPRELRKIQKLDWKIYGF